MSNSALTQIEEGFKRLSNSEQRWLIERLLQHLNKAHARADGDMEQQLLALMAADPEIQDELERIDREFSYAEADGLETA